MSEYTCATCGKETDAPFEACLEVSGSFYDYCCEECLRHDWDHWTTNERKNIVRHNPKSIVNKWWSEEHED